MNMWHSLIQELMHYEYKLGYTTTEANKYTCCGEGEGTIDYCIVTR